MFKPLIVPPDIYFVDSREAVIEMLQGEVTWLEDADRLARSEALAGLRKVRRGDQGPSSLRRLPRGAG